MNRIMLDLETWGTRPTAVIAAIGAVKFGKDRKDGKDGKIYSEFYQRVDPKTCLAVGMKMDIETVQWWMVQSDEARKEMVKAGVSIRDALANFSSWSGQAFDPITEIWGNGATFDNVILSSAYSAIEHEKPWKFSADRCYRTLKNLFPAVKYQGVIGVVHHALDDARAQALHLMEIEKLIKL